MSIKNLLPEALCNLFLSVCAKFERCAAKTVGGVGFLAKAYFFAVAVLPIPRLRLPELRYRLEIHNGRSHCHFVCKVY